MLSHLNQTQMKHDDRDFMEAVVLVVILDLALDPLPM